MNPSLWFPALVVFGWALLFWRGALGIRATTRLRPEKTELGSSVSAFVPARNEEEILDASVRSLLAQPVSKVTVVDDNSTDRTPEILRALAGDDDRLVVLSGEGPKPGECGKPAALRFAVEQTQDQSDWYLFLDADVVLEPGAVSALVAFAEQEKRDMVSLFPRMELGSALECVVMPSVGAVIAANHRPARVFRSDTPDAFANGQLILVRREVYESIGGHGAVIQEILEDVRLAQIVKDAGHAIAIVDGRDIARTRMYQSFDELVEGWSKNLFLLMGRSRARTVRWAALGVVLGWASIAALVVGGWPFGVAAWALVTSMQAGLRAMGGTNPAWAVAAPIGSLAAAWLLLRSMWIHARGAVPWKGRTYPPAS